MKNQNWIAAWNDTGLGRLTLLRNEMNDAFDDLRDPNRANRLYRQEGSTGHFVPACEVEEGKEHFLLSIEMPGISRDDVKLEALDGKLFVSGERRTDRKSRDGGTWYSESRYGTFERRFALPPGIDTDKIEAHQEDGVLRIYIPKAESAKPRQIKIGNVGSAGFFGVWMGQSSAQTKEGRNGNVSRRDDVAS